MRYVINYDGKDVILPERAIDGLIQYAEMILSLMQEVDEEFSHCWYTCVIDIDSNLQPSFRFGESQADVTENTNGLIVVTP